VFWEETEEGIESVGRHPRKVEARATVIPSTRRTASLLSIISEEDTLVDYWLTSDTKLIREVEVSE
jgi:hypothetical protein